MKTIKRIRALVTQDEIKTAEALGGRRVTLSGAGQEKGDGRVRGLYRIENKWTEAAHYSLHVRDFGKLCRTALAANEEPLFVVKVSASDLLPLKFVVIRDAFARGLGLVPKIEREGEHKTLRISDDTFGKHCLRYNHKVRRQKALTAYYWPTTLQDRTETHHVTVLFWEDFLWLKDLVDV